MNIRKRKMLKALAREKAQATPAPVAPKPAPKPAPVVEKAAPVAKPKPARRTKAKKTTKKAE